MTTRGEIEVWVLPLTGETTPAERGLLSAAELDRVRRFDAVGAACDYVRIRATLRRLLSDRTGCPPRELVFVTGPHGKPELRSAPVPFNITHTRGLALLAIAKSGAVGVDAEAVDIYARDVTGLISRVLTPREVAVVGGDRRRFLEHWVAKESYLKWLGHGLTVSPDELELATDSAGRPVITSPGRPTHPVHRLDLGHDHIGAVVCDGHSPRIQLRQIGGPS